MKALTNADRAYTILQSHFTSTYALTRDLLEEGTPIEVCLI